MHQRTHKGMSRAGARGGASVGDRYDVKIQKKEEGEAVVRPDLVFVL